MTGVAPTRTLVATVVAAMIASSACVGEDPGATAGPAPPSADPGVPAGAYRGACYGNGTCDAGLECVQGVVCLYPDGGGPPAPEAGPDGAKNDAGGVPDGASGADAGVCGWSKPGPTIDCPTTNACPPAQPICCFDTATSSCHDTSTPCTGGLKPHRCDSKASCTTLGTICCMQTTSGSTAHQDVLDQTTCPRAMSFADFNMTGCGSACGATDFVVCLNDGECSSGRCVRLVVQPGLELGICVP